MEGPVETWRDDRPQPSVIQRIRYVLLGNVRMSGPGANRTRDTRFRRAVLYPLSYWAVLVGYQRPQRAC